MTNVKYVENMKNRRLENEKPKQSYWRA